MVYQRSCCPSVVCRRAFAITSVSDTIKYLSSAAKFDRCNVNGLDKSNLQNQYILLSNKVIGSSAKYIHAYHAIPLDNTIQCERFSRKRSLAECAGNLFNLTLAILSIFKSREAVIDRLRGLIKRVLQRIKV